MSEDEVDLQTQLNVALELLTTEQHYAWKQCMENIQLQCSLADAKKRIRELEKMLDIKWRKHGPLATNE